MQEATRSRDPTLPVAALVITAAANRSSQSGNDDSTREEAPVRPQRHANQGLSTSVRPQRLHRIRISESGEPPHRSAQLRSVYRSNGFGQRLTWRWPSKHWRRCRDRQRDWCQWDGQLWGVSGSAMRTSAILRSVYSSPRTYWKSLSYLPCGQQHGSTSLLTFCVNF